MSLILYNTILENIIKKYENNNYILQKLNNYMNSLESLLDNDEENRSKRLLRNSKLTMEQENFYKVFINNNLYYYLPNNNCFYEYDLKTYKVIKEDDIQYNLLSTITEEGKLNQWKYKTKREIIKKIKERNLFKSIPESFTIQKILNFLKPFFESKMHIKYFLSVIGDFIFKKNNDLLYFVDTNTKKFVSFIDTIIYLTIGYSCLNNFITKYHNSHNLYKYRLIKNINYSISDEIIKQCLDNIGIDLLCVACYYSDIYSTSDNYIQTKTYDDFKNYVLYFSYNPQNIIICNFINQTLEKTEGSLSANFISWKNMHYLWKLYLYNNNIPNTIYSNNLKDILKQHITFNEENNDINFINITSKYLPNVSSFLSFWNKYITIESSNDFDDEYEVEEIYSLYKLIEKNNQITDEDIIKIISHYFSHIEIIDNKYITNIYCSLWNKKQDIIKMLEHYRETNKNKSDSEVLISIDELYESYKSYYKALSLLEKTIYNIVGKNYFEKFILYYLSNYVCFDKFVSFVWLKDDII